MTRALASAALLGLLACTAAAPVAAADYLDDRSSAAALVRSYYNAIDRHEYARAWSYFGAEPPVRDYAGFVAGYADTEQVELALGPVREEGAAGSLYASVPVAIAAHRTDGSLRVFAGCYVTRLLQPANQEPPFAPRHIERASLAPAEPPLSAAVPLCSN